jgi:T5orf172 domain
MKKRDGFLYILRHPERTFKNYGLRDGEHLYKIGVTSRTLKVRLKQHNTDFTKAAGMVVQETGQLWDVVDVYTVQDVYAAERIFWGHSPFADIPFIGGVEVMPMMPADVQTSIEAVMRFCYGTCKVDNAK